MQKRHAALSIALASACLGAQDIALKSGESHDLFGVYWVGNCKSLLQSFAGADIVTGPPNLQVSLREQEVLPVRQNCPDKVPGAMLVISAGEVSTAYEGTVRIRVKYNTTDGVKQSIHAVKLVLFPAR